MLLPVKFDDSVKLLDTEEILFLSTYNKRVKFHTHNQKYYDLVTLDDFYMLLRTEGFAKLDRNNIVRLQSITRFDSDTKIAYFDREGFPTEACTVSENNVKMVKNLKL
jgi:DNA-binding LytR/AlgR family response regulator